MKIPSDREPFAFQLKTLSRLLLTPAYENLRIAENYFCRQVPAPEIAAMMRMSEGAVRARIRRIRRKLRNPALS